MPWVFGSLQVKFWLLPIKWVLYFVEKVFFLTEALRLHKVCGKHLIWNFDVTNIVFLRTQKHPLHKVHLLESKDGNLFSFSRQVIRCQHVVLHCYLPPHLVNSAVCFLKLPLPAEKKTYYRNQNNLITLSQTGLTLLKRFNLAFLSILHAFSSMI